MCYYYINSLCFDDLKRFYVKLGLIISYPCDRCIILVLTTIHVRTMQIMFSHPRFSYVELSWWKTIIWVLKRIGSRSWYVPLIVPRSWKQCVELRSKHAVKLFLEAIEVVKSVILSWLLWRRSHDSTLVIVIIWKLHINTNPVDSQVSYFYIGVGFKL